ncbi:MAG: carboxylating nicotinate-nucleotide diphosphorylase [Chlamydiota bacterium]
MDFFDIPQSDLEELIRKAFAEDHAYNDMTSAACLSEEAQAFAKIVLKQPGCIAGLKFIPWIFQLFDPHIETEVCVHEGAFCEKETLLARLRGPARSILSAERVAVNFLQHLSGIATLTARCKEKVQGTSCQILDTRKTILGLRSLQKYAVRVGGGTNHRLHLADRILIKNNHLALAGNPSPLTYCIQNAKRAHPQSWIEVEIDSSLQLVLALEAGAHAILLDNMTPSDVSECVALNKKRAYLEASGGITLDNLSAYAATGVDGISMGALTHSAPALDISLRAGFSNYND